MKKTLVLLILLSGSGLMPARAAEPAKPAIFESAASLKAKAQNLNVEARASSTGVATATLQSFPNYRALLSVRVRNGQAEYHEHWSDVFVVLKGSCILETGGTIRDMKAIADGEYVGASIQGGTKQVLKAGDTFYIPPRTPHQAFPLRSGLGHSRSFVIYVVKVPEAKPAQP